MDNQVHNQIVSFIWGIADDCLRDVYVRGKYRDVILPMTVIRRLDAMLEETKPAVLAMKKQLDAAKIDNQWPALCNAAGQAFCNASPFLLKDLTSRSKAQTLKADFKAYLDGFSPNVQVILDKFKFRNQIDTMVDADILGAVIEKFTSSDINLSPNPIYKDEAKKILKHPGLDNHGMGTIFEELIRKFNEENNEEAGEHWTPRDVVELMADLVFMPIADKIKDASYSCYDGACGTGGMLTVAQDRLLTLAKRRGKEVAIHLFGQEINPETYAICTADMLLKGDGEEAEHIMYGSTLSDDQHASRQFDFMLSNPPYGKSWKTDAEKMGGKKEILDTRFNTYLENGDTMTMIPRTSDGQLLFLLDWKVSITNKLISVKKNRVAAYKELRKAVIDQGILHGFKSTDTKDSGIYWLGEIPESWEILPLKRICRANASIADIVKAKENSELVTFLPMENVTETGEIDCSIKKKVADVRTGFSSFAKGDVVVAKITPCFENGKGACLDDLDTDIGFGRT